MNKYIKAFPQPFLDELLKSNVVPFVGSGMSNNAELPKGEKMPLWDQLGQSFKKILGKGYDKASSIEAISAFETKYSKQGLIEKLRELLYIDLCKPGKSHDIFGRLPFNIVCTTNFDNLLEDTYSQLKKSFVVKVREDQLSTTTRKNKVEILKYHGDLNNPSQLIATEDDYDSYIIKNPLMCTYICSLLLTKTPLFIGYSLDDADFRQIFQLIKSRIGKMTKMAYVISFNCDKATEDRFNRRGVQVINLQKGENETYDEVLSAALKELYSFWTSNVALSPRTNSYGQWINVDNKFSEDYCFLAVPESEVQNYYDELGEAFSTVNLKPISIESITTESESELEKMEVLLNRAKYIIIDVDEFELPKISRNANNSKVISISKNPFPRNKKNALVRPDFESYKNEDKFENVIKYWGKLRELITKEFVREEQNKTDELFERGEYALSVIESIRQLEVILRKTLMGEQGLQEVVPLTILVRKAVSQKIIPNDRTSAILWALYQRNSCIHQDCTIEKSQAEDVIRITKETIKTIEEWKRIN
ncbi:MAG: SIR2 family protein [Prevotellaceae bacterium]|nr:SIR2 family protein [Prevotellaceae bacterium]